MSVRLQPMIHFDVYFAPFPVYGVNPRVFNLVKKIVIADQTNDWEIFLEIFGRCNYKLRIDWIDMDYAVITTSGDQPLLHLVQRTFLTNHETKR